jgi:hypothetical protein
MTRQADAHMAIAMLLLAVTVLAAYAGAANLRQDIYRTGSIRSGWAPAVPATTLDRAEEEKIRQLRQRLFQVQISRKK